MATNPPRRKVLIIEDEPSIRNVLYVLLAGLGYDGDAVPDAYQGLSMIRKGEFDAVLLDLRSSQIPPDQMVCAITELRPSLVGRVLVITGEVSHPRTIEMLERYALPHVPRSRIISELSRGIAQMDGLLPSYSHQGNRWPSRIPCLNCHVIYLFSWASSQPKVKNA